jgi:hypothetical protein
MSYQKCKNLLTSMETVYSTYSNEEKKYYQDLTKYQDLIESKIIDNQDTGDITAPEMPILIFPTITCGPCRREFQALQDDFSHHSLAKVNQCINNLKQNDETLQQQYSEKETNQKQQYPEKETDQKQQYPEKKTIQQPSNAIIISSTPRPIVDKTDIGSNKGEYTKPINITMIVISGLLLLGCFYLVYCISRNLPYDLVCSKLDIIQQAEQVKQTNKNNHKKNKHHHHLKQVLK